MVGKRRDSWIKSAVHASLVMGITATLVAAAGPGCAGEPPVAKQVAQQKAPTGMQMAQAGGMEGHGGMKGSAGMQAKMMQMIKKMQSLAPDRGYLNAHQSEKNPPDLLGGPLKVTITQDAGGVFVAMPGPRRLDPVIFGPPKLPRHYGGTPIITGVPPMMRMKKNGVLQTGRPTPFGDKYMVMGSGRLHLEAIDATALDGATTKDKVKMMASWKDKAGNTYAVKCCKMLAAHGVEYPTFGGVATNTLMHGFTSIGTPLMPTEYSFVAFWGMGAVMKNGKVLDSPRLIHGMLTEYVRTRGYTIGFDKDVTSTRRQFHLMVPPMKPIPAKGIFMHSPVKTGLGMPNGMKLPFWHVMFETLKVNAHRG